VAGTEAGAVRHGTTSGYVDHCRCAECRAAWATYTRRRRANRAAALAADQDLVEHGTRSTYVNYACRCNECTAAHSAYCKRYNQTRRSPHA
jgi:predicted metal-binding protein